MSAAHAGWLVSCGAGARITHPIREDRIGNRNPKAVSRVHFVAGACEHEIEEMPSDLERASSAPDGLPPQPRHRATQ